MKKQIKFEQFGTSQGPVDKQALFNPSVDRVPIDAILRHLESDLGEVALSYTCQGIEEKENKVHYKILFGRFEGEKVRPSKSVWVAF